MEVIHPDAAGIDIGNESHYVAVPPSRDNQPVRRFGCITGELKAMANRLKQCRIRTVAMQSTGVYWIAVFDILEEADAATMAGRETEALVAEFAQLSHRLLERAQSALEGESRL